MEISLWAVTYTEFSQSGPTYHHLLPFRYIPLVISYSLSSLLRDHLPSSYETSTLDNYCILIMIILSLHMALLPHPVFSYILELPNTSWSIVLSHSILYWTNCSLLMKITLFNTSCTTMFILLISYSGLLLPYKTCTPQHLEDSLGVFIFWYCLLSVLST